MKRLSDIEPGTDGNSLAPSPYSASLSQRASGLRTPRPMRDSDRPDSALFRVELALSRLENGDYGYCVICDTPIAIEQLELDPSRVVCGCCTKADA